MNYDGTKRFKDEIFELIGARNDDALVRVKYVVLWDEKKHSEVRDDSGRCFISEGARQHYRMSVGNEAVIVRRPVGRPAGSKAKTAKSA